MMVLFLFLVELFSSHVYFANSTITFHCIIGIGDGIQWHLSDSINTEGINYDSHTKVGTLRITNSSNIQNGTLVQCKATNNGTPIESSQRRIVILQGISL